MTAFSRPELLAKLRLVAPALGKPAPVPLLAHAFLDGEDLWAGNGVLAIRTPCPTPFRCAVPGKPLLDLLAATALVHLDLRLDGERLLVQGGWSPARKRFSLSVSLPCLPDADFPFTVPEDPSSDEVFLLPVDEGTRQALKLAALVADPDSTTVELRGPTLVGGDPATLYATNGRALLAATLSHALPDDLALTLPLPFVQQVLRLGSGDEDSLAVWDSAVVFETGETLLYGSPLPVRARRVHFPDLVARNLSEPSWTELPETWGLLGRRAVALGGPDAVTAVSVRGGILTLVTEGPGGAITDEVAVDAPDGGPVRLPLALLRRVAAFPLPYFTLAPGGLALGGGPLVYMVARKAS